MKKYRDHKIDAIGNLILSILIALTMIGSDLGRITPVLAYLKYTVIVIFLAFFLNPKRYYPKSIKFILLIFLFSFVKSWQFNSRMVVELIFMTISILPFFVFDFKNIDIKRINKFIIIIFLLIHGSSIGLKLDVESFLLSETSSTETNISAFIFSMLFTFFLVKKDKRWMIINLAMSLIAFKRISFLSIIFIYIVYLFSFHKKYKKNTIYIVVNLVVVLIFSFLASGIYDDFIMRTTGLPIGQFTQGRSVFLAIIMEEINKNYFYSLFVGVGQGEVVNILEAELGAFELFHNDIFKLFWEYGIFLFIIILSALYKFNNKLLAIQFNIFMFTDNVLVYTPVLFTFLMLSNLLKKENLEKA